MKGGAKVGGRLTVAAGKATRARMAQARQAKVAGSSTSVTGRRA